MIFEELKKYEYTIPEELIAQEHAEPRDSARLLVYHTNTGVIEHRIFRELVEILPDNASVVLNKTKVMPARLILNKSTGGKIEVLVLLNESTEQGVATLIKQDVSDGQELYHNQELVLRVIHKTGPKYSVEWLHPSSILEFMRQHGTTPLPPYIKSNTQTESQKRESYQSVFAKLQAKYFSVAAPTASLHFTPKLITNLADQHTLIEVELAIGMGTFGLLKPHHFETQSLHTEWVRMAGGEYNKLQDSTQVLAVGTTALRTLECIDAIQPDEDGDRAGWTDLFVTPPHKFGYATMLLTNFHVPCSSLMLMVEAFLQDRGAKHSLVEIYNIAIEHKYRFYSLGDAMLIIE